MKVCFIINPTSGRPVTRERRRERIAAVVEALGMTAVFKATKHKRHALSLTRQAVDEGFTRVVSVGGDGTMNEVATGLVGTGVDLGLVPLGSGNGLARDLGLPLEFGEAVKVALTGSTRLIDSGRVNGQAFFNVMGMGFDAELGRRFNLSEKRGFLTYLRLGLETFIQYRNREYEVSGPGLQSLRFSAFLVSVANSTQYGNGARIAPRALLDDGRLDLAAVTSANPLWVPTLITRLFAGTVDRSSRVIHQVGERFIIVRGKPGPVHTDGEIYEMGLKLEVEVCPASVRVVVR